MFGMTKALASLALLAIVAGALPARASYIDIDLSKPEVELTASFDGAELLLFGIHNPGTDVIVIVRGPGRDTGIRKKEQVAGIWMNGDEVIFKGAPTFYTAASTAPPAEILPAGELARLEIGIENLNLESSSEDVAREEKAEFFNGLLRNMEKTDLYRREIAPISKVGKQLFRTNLWFPSNVSVGDYVVTTHLVRDQKVISTKSTDIIVHKVGIEADIYNFAHNYALFYGLLAILIAVVSGWTANAIFRKG